MAWLEAPVSFITTQRLSRRGLSRARFDLLQQRAIDRWLKRDVAKVSMFAAQPRRLSDVPHMDKAQLMGNFAAYNRDGITAEEVREALTRDLRIGALTVGASTGTSGNRGLFVISERERFRWLGSILAKSMADMLWRQQRVAIILPQGTGLYDSANRMRQIKLRFFDLSNDPEDWRPSLEAFDPTVIVAPPKVLRHFAKEQYRLRPVRVFSAAETLDPVDRPVIEAAFGCQLGQIYMATEGLLGVTCRHGRLHLAEDSIHFEFEAVGDGLVTPIISSFRRQTQILARYRMNDLLRLDPAPCPCGAPQRVAAEIVGRMDDCFHLAGPQGDIMVTPDVLRNAVLTADPSIDDFRVIQTGANAIEVALAPSAPEDAANAVLRQLNTLLGKRGLSPEITLQRAPFPLDRTRKLRRVECRHSPVQAR